MQLRTNIILLGLALSLAACEDPTLPDPEIQMPAPPETLMVPPQELKTLKKEPQ